MKKFINNKKMIYGLILLIIIVGIIITAVFKFNFSLEYDNSTRVNMYIGKDCNIEDIKQISEEVFGKQSVIYQKIETFNDSVAITLKEVTDEQIENLKQKLIEKYELEDADNNIVTVSQVAHLRGRDIIKPYIVPIVITTIIILAYVGIRYTNLGIYKTIFTLLFRLILSEAVLLSIIAITRIPISIYTMPIAVLVYITVITITVSGYQKTIEKANK